MSEDAVTGEEGLDEAFEKKPAGTSKIVLIVMLAAGAGVGARFGGPIVTPLIAEATAGSPDDGGDGYGEGENGTDDGYGGASDGYGGSEGGGSDAAEPFVIESLVLNPASSGGSRFLVASLAIDASADTQTELAARDAEARDLLHTVLASRTVEELSDVTLRDEIREDLRVTLNAMLGYDGVRRIFFPQFVIQ